MRRAAFTLLACLLLCSLDAYAQTSDSLTEQQVLDIINSIDRAARRKSIAGVVGPLAEDVKIKLTVLIPGTNEEKTLTLTKDEYTFQTKRAFQTRFRYTLQRKKLQIKIYEDGQTAMITSDVYESFSNAQATLRSVAAEVSFINLRNGKPMITSVEGRLRFY